MKTHIGNLFVTAKELDTQSRAALDAAVKTKELSPKDRREIERHLRSALAKVNAALSEFKRRLADTS